MTPKPASRSRIKQLYKNTCARHKLVKENQASAVDDWADAFWQDESYLHSCAKKALRNMYEKRKPAAQDARPAPGVEEAGSPTDQRLEMRTSTNMPGFLWHSEQLEQSTLDQNILPMSRSHEGQQRVEKASSPQENGCIEYWSRFVKV